MGFIFSALSWLMRVGFLIVVVGGASVEEQGKKAGEALDRGLISLASMNKSFFKSECRKEERGKSSQHVNKKYLLCD